MHQVQFKVFRRTLCWVCSFYIWYRVGCGPYHWEGRWHSTREYIFVKWCCHDIISCRVAIPPSQRQKESFLPEVLPAACDKKMLGLKMVEVEDIKSGSFHFKVSDGFCFVLPWRAIESLFALTFESSAVHASTFVCIVHSSQWNSAGLRRYLIHH